MGAISKILRSTEGGVAFRCPACDWTHAVPINSPTRPSWSWNGNVDKPSFTPSINITTIRPEVLDEPLGEAYDAMFAEPGGREKVLADPRFRYVCHSIVTDGRITFCSDCTHALAGQTVDIPPFHKEDQT